ncbi:hypothetical protein [Aquabacterium humicola]|uniref:hypothetical protein n=1 Tax=Aquabacterium humicola TaxID=3237377 RepID=UPI002542E8E3|nr:hypothetical protein [Rubrivivax pictus]
MADITLPQWVSPVADLLSLVGFGITVWVLVVTRSLKRAFALRARTPELRKSLAASAKSLPTLIRTWPLSRSDTLGELANVRALLENLRIKLPRSERATIDQLIRALRGRRKALLRWIPASEYAEDDLWKIFADLQGVVTALEQREKDAKWE